MESWEGFIQGIAKEYAGARIDAQYRQPIEIQKLRIAAAGPFGVFEEGQAVPMQAAPFGGIPPVFLLAGAALFAVLLLKD